MTTPTPTTDAVAHSVGIPSLNEALRLSNWFNKRFVGKSNSVDELNQMMEEKTLLTGIIEDSIETPKYREACLCWTKTAFQIIFNHIQRSEFRFEPVQLGHDGPFIVMYDMDISASKMTKHTRCILEAGTGKVEAVLFIDTAFLDGGRKFE